MTEPEKVIAPIAMPSPISIRLTAWIAPSGIGDAERIGVEIGGDRDQHRGEPDQAVEGGDELRHRGHRDRRAVTRPIAAPIEDRDADLGQRGDRVDGCVASVVPTASAMPNMPKRLPRRLVAGLESPRRARMKQMPATR
jgi:hypothetical protein